MPRNPRIVKAWIDMPYCLTLCTIDYAIYYLNNLFLNLLTARYYCQVYKKVFAIKRT